MVLNEDQGVRYALRVRRMFHEADTIRDEGLATPEDVERYDSIPYGTDCEKWQCLDVYRPKGNNDRLPVIVSVHGGGWVYGDKEVYQFYCMSLAQFGFAVVNFSYRLAPEYRYPASFEDLNTVLQWVSDHAKEYGFDRDHVFAVGDSAGAHMLSLYCCALVNEHYRSTLPYSIQEAVRFQAIALNCGVYDLSEADQGIRGLIQVLLPEGSDQKALDELSPCTHITSGFPPVFLMAANDDNLKQQSYLLKPLLETHQIPFVFRLYGTEDHPLPHVFHCNMKLEDASACNKEETDYFRSFVTFSAIELPFAREGILD